MVSLSHLEAALAAVDAQIKALLYNENLAPNEKDHKMLSLHQENKILKQAYEDLCCLKEDPACQNKGERCLEEKKINS